MTPSADPAVVADQFESAGRFVSAIPYGGGHINDTFLATYEGAQLVLQRINDNVFREPVKLMDNVRRVLDHVATAAPAGQSLRLIPGKAGAPYVADSAGKIWRAYNWIENATAHDIVENETQAFEAAKAFGAFQSLLADMPPPRLHDTIPDFHNTPKRFADFEDAVNEDAAGRCASCMPEIDFCLARKEITPVLLDLHSEGAIPERVTHNDCKLNNVLLDNDTGKAVCVIDLDTCMPGLSLYDFGDLVRTSTSPAAEDERDTSKVVMRMDMFEALARGFLETAGDVLAPAEVEHLPFAGKLITLEIGIRFLTDYLCGDTYFKTKYDAHNLVRFRTQMALVQSIEAQEDVMQSMVRAL